MGTTSVASAETPASDSNSGSTQTGDVASAVHASPKAAEFAGDTASGSAPAVARPAAPVLEVDGFSKSYGRKTVVRDINLSVYPGSIFGFIGHNGAGKTTLIRSIVGALHFEKGDIRVCGHSIKTEPVRCKQVCAYVPDSPDVYGYLKGSQYLTYVADIFGVSRSDRVERIERYAGRLGIQDRLDEMVSAYSHGMRQKLVLTGAFIHEPTLLVLDEPFVGLDPEAAYELRKMMGELTSRGGAIFLSSHMLDTVERLCDRVAIIRNGEIVRAGTTEEIRQDESLEQVFLEIAREGRDA